MKHAWRSLEDDREVSASYAARHPDAVYDAADPEWWDILYWDEEAAPGEADDIADGEADEQYEFDTEEFESGPDVPSVVLEDYEWTDEDNFDDDGWIEVEIGISYPDDV